MRGLEFARNYDLNPESFNDVRIRSTILFARALDHDTFLWGEWVLTWIPKRSELALGQSLTLRCFPRKYTMLIVEITLIQVAEVLLRYTSS